MVDHIILALGSNVAGDWGCPQATLLRSVHELERSELEIVCVSRLYRTLPIGLLRQPAFLNFAISVETSLTARELVTTAKRLEWQAGRRRSKPWGPRPLDIDLIDFRGRVIGWPPGPEARPPLVLPHPEAHRRGFVLLPLLDIAPHWRHPALNRSGAELLARNPRLCRGMAMQLDLGWHVCQ